MGERTILSSFYSAEEARQAAKQVKSLGADVAQVDTLRAYAGDEPIRDSFPISGKIPGLASLTLDAEPDSRDVGVLMAADPSASGMSDGEDNVTGRNYLLTVICDDAQVDQAVSIIKACNGYT